MAHSGGLIMGQNAGIPTVPSELTVNVARAFGSTIPRRAASAFSFESRDFQQLLSVSLEDDRHQQSILNRGSYADIHLVPNDQLVFLHMRVETPKVSQSSCARVNDQVGNGDMASFLGIEVAPPLLRFSHIHLVAEIEMRNVLFAESEPLSDTLPQPRKGNDLVCGGRHRRHLGWGT